MRTKPALLAAALALATTPAVAQSRIAKDKIAEDKIDLAALSLAKSFAKICILTIPIFENVMLTARLEGWRQVEGPPRDRPAKWHGPAMRSAWLTKGVDGLPVGVIIARKPDERVKAMTATCAVQSPDVAAAGMSDALAAILPLPDSEPPIVAGDKPTTVWRLQWGNRTVTVAMVAAAAKKPGVILNAVIQENVR